MVILAISATSMPESSRHDHAQGTHPPTQSSTQLRPRGVASPSSRCYHVPRHVPSPLQLGGADAARLWRRGDNLDMAKGSSQRFGDLLRRSRLAAGLTEEESASTTICAFSTTEVPPGV